jgi:DNA primase
MDNTLQDIKDRLNIADVLSGYIQLKKSGVNFKAVCPFHNEKSPSLMVSTQKQIWHCFGCGEGGDIFGFVMRYENLEFRDALKLLADKAGVKLPEYKPKDQNVINKEEQLYKINDFAARFYHEILVKGKLAAPRDYLKKRGLSPLTIGQWQIGFAPEGFHTLEQALVKKKVSLNDLVEAGVSAKNERGQIYDRFRGRITFPIFNSVGNIVGFSARILVDDGKSAKYINSPETAIYNKSRVLFGFNFARTEIRKQDEVIVVEGQMDCISCHQAGFKNVVASSGTALTVEQLMQLGRFTKNVKFCFDADAAGLIATRRAVENGLAQGFTIKILSLVGAKDADELIKKDAKEFARQAAAAPLFLDFYITKQFQNFNQSIAEKKLVEAELLPLLNLLTDPLELDHYLRIVAEKLGTTPHVLLETLHKLKKGSGAVSGNAAKTGVIKIGSVPITGPNALEKQVLGGMLLYPEYREWVIAEGVDKQLPYPLEAESLLAKECIFMVESQLAELGNEPAMMRELKKSLAQLNLVSLKTRQKQLTDEIRRAETKKDSQNLLRLNREFMDLNVKRLELEKLL